MLFAQNVSASTLVGPSCFVTAEVVEIGSETKQLDSGREYESHYLNLKILSVDNRGSCPVQENQVYKAIDNYYATDNYPASFKMGDKIKAGIEAASSMGPSGAVSFLHWSDVTYEDGTTIKYKEGIVTNLQSENEPIVIEKIDDTHSKNKNNVNYYYFIIPVLIIVGFLLYRFLHKRSAP
jgi:hypothetical protein